MPEEIGGATSSSAPAGLQEEPTEDSPSSAREGRPSRVTFVDILPSDEQTFEPFDSLSIVDTQEGNYDVDGLINNDAIQALNGQERNFMDIQRCLEELGILDPAIGSRDGRASTAGGTGMARSNSCQSVSMPMPLSRATQATQDDFAPTISVGSSVRARQRSKDRLDNTDVADRRGIPSVAVPYVQSRQEQELMKRLFRSPSRYSLREVHCSLGRVLQHIFCEDSAPEVPAGASSYSSSFSSWTGSANNCGCRTRFTACSQSPFGIASKLWARKVVNHWCFTGGFLLLTMYTLFSSDLIMILASKDLDPFFVVLNTIVFFLFVVELIVVIFANSRYLFTVPFCLDTISLFSVFQDTYFMRNGGWLEGNDQASRLSRMARTSKMTRLARIARVARITKLIPKLMRVFRKQNASLAKKLLMRRMWRVFLFLTKDTDGLLSSFDIKVFYISIMTECGYLLKRPRAVLLMKDVDRLCDSLQVEDEMMPRFDFDQFVNIISATQTGEDLVQFHQDDVDQETGVWSLTQKLSDTTAMKVCVGILVLVCMISFLEIAIEDHSVDHTLNQLTSVVSYEHSQSGFTGTASTDYICDLIDLFILKVQGAFKHNVLYIRLDGWTFYDFDEGGCLRPPMQDTTAAALNRKETLQDFSHLRETELIWACLPRESCLSGGGAIVSAILVDVSLEVKNNSEMALYTILMVILLLLTFVYILNMKINMFSGNLLTPLRSLVDDMQAMSCLELVHIDEDMPADSSKPIQVAEELQHLQVAFKSMRSAIRSWSKYVPACVVERLYISGTEAVIGVSKCNATILFVDIDGFEDKCRGLPPNDILRLLENVFNVIGEVIQKHRGTLLEFIADEVLAVFNTPRAIAHHPLAGVRAAQDIHVEINSRSMLVKADGTEVFVRCRVGVHTSNILAGNIGSVKRMKYGLLGDGINQTARIKGLTSRYKTGTLCTEKVLLDDGGRAARFVCTRPVDVVAVKGKKDPTTVYEVLGPTLGFEWQVEAAKKHREAFKRYQSRSFEAGRALFQEVNNLFLQNGLVDEPSRLLMSRCAAYVATPPPADWDGVDRLKSKNFTDSPPPSPEALNPYEANVSRGLGSLNSASAIRDMQSMPFAEDFGFSPFPRGRAQGSDMPEEFSSGSSARCGTCAPQYCVSGFCPCYSAPPQITARTSEVVSA
mmetsp:Transcript_5751/g.21894  ORF Transcript_5751/g.21894 Transcript_5751/m.21894 type:complete len:1171 (-) Transcript_5751:56-3568(-)